MEYKRDMEKRIAEALEEIGVLLLPVRVGDTCYWVWDTEICSFTVSGILWDGKDFYVTEDFGTFEKLGEEVFATEREADAEMERLLEKEREK